MIKKFIKKLFDIKDPVLSYQIVLTKPEDERANRYILHCLIDDLNKMNTNCEFALRCIDLDKTGQAAMVIAEAKVVTRIIMNINKYKKSHQEILDGKTGEKDTFVEEN